MLRAELSPKSIRCHIPDCDCCVTGSQSHWQHVFSSQSIKVGDLRQIEYTHGMEKNQKVNFIQENVSVALGIIQVEASLLEPHGELPLPLSESLLPLPKSRFVWAWKYAIANMWDREDESEQNFSAVTFRESLMVEKNEAVIVDWRLWPKYAQSIWNYWLGRPSNIALYWPDQKVNLFPPVSKSDYYYRSGIRINASKDWKERLERNPDPTSDALIRASDDFKMELIDFLHSLENARREGYDAYWTEVHRKLGMPPPPFAPKSGCFSALIMVAVMMLFGLVMVSRG